MAQTNQTQSTDAPKTLHADYDKDQEVRVEDESALENAAVAKQDSADVNTILQEAQVVGGSDNTSIPAGAGGDEVGDKGQLDRVVDSDTAKGNYTEETASDTGTAAK